MYRGDEHWVYSQIDQENDGLASLLTRLRQRLGMGLIQAGRALAGYDAGRGLPTPTARPASWGSGS